MTLNRRTMRNPLLHDGPTMANSCIRQLNSPKGKWCQSSCRRAAPLGSRRWQEPFSHLAATDPRKLVKRCQFILRSPSEESKHPSFIAFLSLKAGFYELMLEGTGR